MANNPTQWSALGTVVHLFAGADLQNKAAAAITTGSVEVDNAAGNQYGVLRLFWDPTSTPAAGGYISVWFLHAVDGSNYETLLGATLIPQRPADAIFPIGTQGSSAHAQQIVDLIVALPPCKFKAVLQNNTSVASANSSGVSLLDLYPVNDNLVTA